MHPRNVKLPVNRRTTPPPPAAPTHAERTDPMVAFYSAIANWRAAERLGGMSPRVIWEMSDDPEGDGWLLCLRIDGTEVFKRASTHVFRLFVDALASFRSWADDLDRRENELLLEESVLDAHAASR